MNINALPKSNNISKNQEKYRRKVFNNPPNPLSYTHIERCNNAVEYHVEWGWNKKDSASKAGVSRNTLDCCLKRKRENLPIVGNIGRPQEATVELGEKVSNEIYKRAINLDAPVEKNDNTVFSSIVNKIRQEDYPNQNFQPKSFSKGTLNKIS